MSTLELQKELISTISSIEDVSILEQIKQFLQIDKKLNDVRIFTPEERKKIEKALKSFEEGNFYTEAEAEEDIQKWL
jgi:argininosuccinate lyase